VLSIDGASAVRVHLKNQRATRAALSGWTADAVLCVNQFLTTLGLATWVVLHMYQSNLHKILRGALESTKWTRSTKDEDNYRQVLCASLYEKISPNNVEIPSTRSAHGDIKIFGRRIEIKYANNEKVEELVKLLEDFDLLLESKIEFSLVHSGWM
jgi:hypothetical protein